MPYTVNFPPFDAFGHVPSGSPISARPETPETAETEPEKEGGSAVGGRRELHGSSQPPWYFDPYHERVRTALRAIAALDYPAGTLAWAESAHPQLYGRMITIPMSQIEKMWDERLPLEYFESVLADWVQAHRMAGNLYAQHLAGLPLP